jgi:outer membrane protein assembly factor BamB
MSIRFSSSRFGAALLVSILVSVFGAPGLEAADWPMFLKSEDHLARPDKTPAFPLELKWQFKAGGPVYSSPATSGGKLFIGSHDNHLYALDASTGALLWKFKTDGQVVSTPAVANDVVYFGSKDKHVYALGAASGTLKWKFQTDGAVVSSPVVSGGKVYVGSTDSYFYVLDAANGSRVAKADMPDNRKYGGVYSSPAFYDGAVYIAGKNRNVYSLDPASGARNWSFATGSAVYSSPVIDDGGVLYIASFDRSLYAINAKDGKKIWKKAIEDWAYASPALYGNMVFVGLKSGELAGFDRKSASKLRTVKFPAEINATPVITPDGIALVGCDEGTLYAVNLSNMSVVWKYKTGGGIQSTPAVVNGMVYVGSKDGSVYAFGK